MFIVATVRLLQEILFLVYPPISGVYILSENDFPFFNFVFPMSQFSIFGPDGKHAILIPYVIVLDAVAILLFSSLCRACLGERTGTCVMQRTPLIISFYVYIHEQLQSL